MPTDPTQELLSEEQVDTIIASLLNMMLDSVFEQLGSPLQFIAASFGEMKDENVLAISSRLKALKDEWAEKAKAIEDIHVEM